MDFLSEISEKLPGTHVKSVILFTFVKSLHFLRGLLGISQEIPEGNPFFNGIPPGISREIPRYPRKSEMGIMIKFDHFPLCRDTFIIKIDQIWSKWSKSVPAKGKNDQFWSIFDQKPFAGTQILIKFWSNFRSKNDRLLDQNFWSIFDQNWSKMVIFDHFSLKSGGNLTPRQRNSSLFARAKFLCRVVKFLSTFCAKISKSVGKPPASSTFL